MATRQTVEQKMEQVTAELEAYSAAGKSKIEVLAELIARYKALQLERDGYAKKEMWQDKQTDIRELHAILQGINNDVDKDGKLVLKPELRELLLKADAKYREKHKATADDKDKRVIPEVKEAGKTYDKDDLERLKDNVTMELDSLNHENELVLHELIHVYNERQETWQLARAMMTSVDQVKKRISGNMAGR